MLIVLAGCSSAPLSPEQPSGQSPALSVDPSPPGSGLSTTSRIVSGTVNGLMGGVLKNGDWTVRIPAGAFSGIGVVTVTVPDPGVRSCDLHIAPSTLNAFRVPVTLSSRLHSAYEVQDYQMQWWDTDAKEWKVIPSTTSAAT